MEKCERACYVHGYLIYQDSLLRNDRMWKKATQTLNDLYLSLYWKMDCLCQFVLYETVRSITSKEHSLVIRKWGYESLCNFNLDKAFD